MSFRDGTARFQESVHATHSVVDRIDFPPRHNRLAQDQEWCEIVANGRRRHIRFHDYPAIFEIAGLYEELFYERLKCCSPQRVVHLLADVLADYEDEPERLRVLDLGAGNGMVGEQLDSLGVGRITGVDIIHEARKATFRDRPGIYRNYLIADFTDLPELAEETLRKAGFNCLTTVAALGFSDIPAKAFIKALDLIETPGWIAFNIKEEFLHVDDDNPFGQLVQHLSRRRIIQIQAYRRYSHRLSITGEPLYYVAVIARKLRDIPDDLLDDDAVDD